MKEVWRMWKLMRYFVKNQANFVVWNIQNEKPNSTIEELYNSHFGRISNLLVRNRELRIKRIDLALLFSTNQYWKENSLIYEAHECFLPTEENKPLIRKKQFKDELKTIDTQSRIDSCIKGGFIGKDKNNENLIYLTLEGKKFADPSLIGLLGAWLKELHFLATELGAWKQLLLGGGGVGLIWFLIELIKNH